jgi:transcriptional regulator with XRE-family HTH domain
LQKQDVEQQASDAHYGLFVRELRVRRSLTLDQLSSQTGLSKAHLSRFERGEKLLSVAALMRVAKALGVSVSAMLGESVTDDALHLVRGGERTVRKVAKGDGGYRFATLSRPGSETGPAAFIADIPAHSRRTSKVYHAGEEILFVVEGRIEIEFPDRKVLLSKGDYFQFPGHLRHSVKGVAAQSQILVIVVSHDAAEAKSRRASRQLRSRSRIDRVNG